jgi:serine/threonine-protein kinase
LLASSKASPAKRAASTAMTASAGLKPRPAVLPSGSTEPGRTDLPAAAARDEGRPTAAAPGPGAATSVAASVEACRDKLFVVREFCLAAACEKPGARGLELCVKWREEKRLREESKVKQGPQ